MDKVAKLFEQLECLKAEKLAKIAEIRGAIQAELNKKYNSWHELQEMIRKLRDFDGVSYYVEEFDNVEARCRFDVLRSIPYAERDFLEDYLADHDIYVDWYPPTLTVSLGSDQILIVDSAIFAVDRGVYQSGEKIIPESDYLGDGGEVDEERRNALIEAHMERTGFYPGVFLCSHHGNSLYPVSTLPKGVKND